MVQMQLHGLLAIARRFCTQSPVAGLAAARCGNFQLQLTTSPASQWKLEVRSWKLGVAIAFLAGHRAIALQTIYGSLQRSLMAGLAAARCGNFQLQLPTSLATQWKSEVRSWKSGGSADGF
ncbi:hypothetical protein [Nostoc sp.]